MEGGRGSPIESGNVSSRAICLRSFHALDDGIDDFASGWEGSAVPGLGHWVEWNPRPDRTLAFEIRRRKLSFKIGKTPVFVHHRLLGNVDEAIC